LSWLDSRRPDGLSQAEAAHRLVRFGPNVIGSAEARSILAILREQLTSLPILLLAGSAVLSIVTGGLVGAVVIASVVLLNAGIPSRHSGPAVLPTRPSRNDFCRPWIFVLLRSRTVSPCGLGQASRAPPVSTDGWPSMDTSAEPTSPGAPASRSAAR
jgi:hypothetical protein